MSLAQQKEALRSGDPIENLLTYITSQNGDLIETQNGLAEAINALINKSPVVEVHFGEDPPENPTTGDLWYKPSEDRLYQYA